MLILLYIVNRDGVVAGQLCGASCCHASYTRPFGGRELRAAGGRLAEVTCEHNMKNQHEEADAGLHMAVEGLFQNGPPRPSALQDGDYGC